jgi:hypothetical protein
MTTVKPAEAKGALEKRLFLLWFRCGFDGVLMWFRCGFDGETSRLRRTFGHFRRTKKQRLRCGFDVVSMRF